jgi:UDP-N-acetylglucosamine acyltransferase
MPSIHATALVSPKAQLGETTVIGPFAIIEDDVIIGDGTSIGPYCKVDNGARIGKNCTIHQGTVIATPPQDLKYNNEKTEFIMGDNCTVREYCTLNRGTTHSNKSQIGSDCLLMAYVHIAHDCFIGDKVIIANSTQLGGHVTIGYHAIVGGLVALHQFSKIGDHVMIGGAVKVVKDVPPYILAGDTPARYSGLNAIGLKRRGFSREVLDTLTDVYNIIYHSGRNVSQASDYIEKNVENIPEVMNVLEFIRNSSRGIIPTRRT